MRLVMLMIGIFFIACGGEMSITDQSEKSIPRNLSWTDMDLDGDGVGENYVTSIKMQPCSDCFLFAAAGLLEIQFQIDHRLSVMLNLSEQSIHNCLRIPCDGAGDHTIMLEHFKKYGIMGEEYAPLGTWFSCPNCSGPILTSVGLLPVAGIPFYSFTEYTTIVELNTPYADRKMLMVKALQNGPLIVDVCSWWGLGNDNGTMYCREENPSGHPVVVVGYENYGDAFLAKNSHGESKLLKIVFEGGEKCGFAHRAHQIVPGSTYVASGLGEKFCYSMDDDDGDSIPDPHDNCPYEANKDQKNSDKDLFGDACDQCPNNFDQLTGFYCIPKLKPATPAAPAGLSRDKLEVIEIPALTTKKGNL